MITDAMLRSAAGEVSACMLECLPLEQEHDFSPSFQRKIKSLIFKTDRRAAYIVRNCAAILALALTLFATLLTVSPTVRAAVLEWIRDVYYGGTVYSYEGNSPAQEQTEYYLSLLPDGYTLYEIEGIPGGKLYTYHHASGNSLNFIHINGTESDGIYFDTRNYQYQAVPFGKGNADLYLPQTPYDSTVLIWTDPDSNELFSISYRGDVDELVALAESVRKKKLYFL